MELLVGLDVGTTAAKALLFDLQGNLIASASHAYGLLIPQEGWVEQSPVDLWQGVVETCRSLVAQVPSGSRIVALAQASQGGTTIPVDAEGRPTYNAISWMDRRTRAQAERAQKKLDGDRASHPAPGDFVYATTGWPLQNCLPLQHIAWLQENCPHEFAATRWFRFVNDFIMHQLTGRACMNPSDAGMTQLFDITRGDWSGRLLGVAGIRPDQLSSIWPSGAAVGRLTAAASQATGLPQEVLVVNGAHDQYCAAVGAGVIQPGSVLLSCGTAWVILAVPSNLETALRTGMGVGRHAVTDQLGVICSLGGVGASLEWFLNQIWREPCENAYASVNASAARVPVGANGLLFHPLAGGYTGEPGQGGFVGLSLSHTRDEMARAVMEGITYELRRALEGIQAAGIPVTELRMVGGAAESPLWPHLVADITGIPVSVSPLKQAASVGAAILAGMGAGLFSDVTRALVAFQRPETRLEADGEYRQAYDRAFALYRETCDALNRRRFQP
jgi:xylulokinase